MYKTPPSPITRRRNRDRRRAGGFGSNPSRQDPEAAAAAEQLRQANLYVKAAKQLWKERLFLVQVFKKQIRATKPQIRASINRGNQSFKQIEDYYPRYIEQYRQTPSIGYFDFQDLADLNERVQTLERAMITNREDYANLQVTPASSRSNISHLGNYDPTVHGQINPPDPNAGYQQVQRRTPRSQRDNSSQHGTPRSQATAGATATQQSQGKNRTVTKPTRNVTNATPPNRPPLMSPRRNPQAPETSVNGVVIDPVSGREVIVEDVGIESLRESLSDVPEVPPVPAQNVDEHFQRDDGGLDQDAFAEDFQRLHGNSNSANNMRSTGINDLNVSNVLRDAILDPTGLEQRIESLRARAQAVADTTQLLRDDPIQLPSPPPNYEEATEASRRDSPPGNTGQTFVPIRLPPGQGMYEMAARRQASFRENQGRRRNDSLDNHVQNERVRQLERENRRLRDQNLSHQARQRDQSHTRRELTDDQRRQRRAHDLQEDGFLQNTLNCLDERSRRDQVYRPLNRNRSSMRSSTAVDRAAERAAKEEAADAARRRRARQYVRDFEARPPSEVDEQHLDAHIIEDPVTHRPRQILDSSYGFAPERHRSSRNSNREQSYAHDRTQGSQSYQRSQHQSAYGPHRSYTASQTHSQVHRIPGGGPPDPDPGSSDDPDSDRNNRGGGGGFPRRGNSDSDRENRRDRDNRRRRRQDRQPGDPGDSDPDSDPEPDPNPDRDADRRRRRRRRNRDNDLTDSDFTSSSDEEGVPDHLPGRWYMRHFPGPWAKKPYKAINRDDKYRSLTNIKIEKFDGNPDAYSNWASKVISQIHRNPSTWSNKLTAIEACIDFKAAPLASLRLDVEWTPMRYINLIKWLDQRFGGAKVTISQHMDQIMALPKCSKNMLELETLNSLAIAHKSLLRVYRRYNVSEVERLYTEVSSRLHEHWSDQYLSQVDTSPDGNGFGEHGQLGLESLLRYMDKKLADWRALKLYSSKYVPKSKPKKDDDKSNKTKSNHRVHVATAQDGLEEIPELQDNSEGQDAETSAVFYGTGSGPSKANQAKPMPKFKVTTPERKTFTPKPAPPGCPCCGGPHDLGYNCSTFVNSSMAKRRTTTADAKACYRCLKCDHFAKDCTGKKCIHCGKGHHELLHYEGKKTNKIFTSFVTDSDPTSIAFAEQDSSDDEAEHSAHLTAAAEAEAINTEMAQAHTNISNPLKPRGTPDISLRVLAIKIRNHSNKAQKTVNMLLDEGADRSYLDESVAQSLGLRGAAQNIILNGAGGKTTKYKALKTLAQITSMDNNTVNRRVLFTILPSSVGAVSYTDWHYSKKHWKHLQSLPDVQITSGPVVGIIGGMEADLLAATQADITGPTGAPVARKCKLGWTILGKTDPRTSWSEERLAQEIQEAQAMIFKCVQTQVQLIDAHLTNQDTNNFATFNLQKRRDILDSDLNDLVKKQMEIESLPDDEEKQMSRDDLYAQQVMNKTMRRLPDGRYECGALWKKGEPQMPNNSRMR
jgi:hypothetical protein